MEPMDIAQPHPTERVVHILRLEEGPAGEQVVAIVDEAKRQVACMLVGTSAAVDGEVEEDAPRCVWCYDGIPSGRVAVGCPVAFVCAQNIRTQVQKGRDDFTIRENVAAIDDAAGAGVNIAHRNILLQDRPAHYKVKYQFCTLNCVLAFATAKNTRRTVDALFANSVVLAHKLYRALAGAAAPDLIVAPHWSLLRSFGGPLTRAIYRERIGNAVYVEHGHAMLPLFRAYGCLVEEKILLH